MKQMIVIVLLVLVAGCSAIRPTADEEMQLRTAASPVAAENVKCQAGDMPACMTSMDRAGIFFLLIRAVAQINPDWAADAQFDYVTCAESMRRCEVSPEMCAGLSQHHAAQVADYMTEAAID